MNNDEFIHLKIQEIAEKLGCEEILIIAVKDRKTLASQWHMIQHSNIEDVVSRIAILEWAKFNSMNFNSNIAHICK